MAALTALVVVCAALSGYATVLDGARPTADRNLAPATLDNVESHLAGETGVVELRRVRTAPSACPDGYSCRVAVAADDERRTVGPDAPTDADADATSVSVRIAPGRVRFGTLRVVVWR